MFKREELLSRPASISWPSWLGLLLALIVLPVTLAWISSRFQSLQGWGSFLGVMLFSAGLLWLGWRLLRVEAPPRWLGGLLVLAAVLRLALGAVWFIVLPLGGYNSPAEQGGYVAADAAERDRAAWELAKSEKPLLRAFGGFRKADQYGGMLYYSALLYRFLGGSTHAPLLVVGITSAFSALAVLFSWAFAHRAFGGEAARWTAWGLALYPEVVLLGSSQMREAFLVPLVAAAFYGFMRYSQEHSWPGLAWVFGALLLSLPLSPPVTAVILILLGVQSLWMGRGLFGGRVLRQRRFWFILLGLILAALAGIWLSWSRIAPEGVANPLALISWWLQKSADWQQHLSERASGWIQKIFDETPDWMNLPLLLVYGIVRPFLPAALIDITSVPVWRFIAIWRAVGWTLLLPLLLYAPVRAFGKGQWRQSTSQGIARGLCVVVWIVIFLASFRGGGDEWDNARYRGAFASLQVALAAWVLVEQRRTSDAWLRRILVGTALILAWFFPWYLRRYVYLPWPIASFYLTLALGIFSAVLYMFWDYWRNKRK